MTASRFWNWYGMALLVALPPAVEAKGRTFLYREANLAVQYSFQKSDMFASPMPPGNSLGLEFVHTRKAPGRGTVGLVGVDIHTRLQDPVGPARLDLFFEDAWALFQVGGRRSQVRVGHFNIPFGMNPVMEPRGIFRMPLEATDLGFKKDWGIGWQRETGRFDAEFGAFLGTGSDLHWRRGSFTLAGRLGTPTFRNFEHGISFLLAHIPPTMGNVHMGDMLMRRVRTGFDAVYLYGNYTILKGEVSMGTDDGRTAVGALFAIDWIPPRSTRWNLGFQAEALRRNLPGMFDDLVRTTWEIAFSLGDLTLLRVDLVRVMVSSMDTSTELFFMVHHYGH